MLEYNKIYNMDCIEGIKLLEDNSIDLVVIDPPYKLDLNKIKNTTTFNSYANELLGLKDGFDLKVLDLLIQKMKKINIYIYCSKRQIQELLEYFTNKGCNYEVLTCNKQKKYKHPTIKPMPFIENHIENSSRPGEVVLDCFAGSGTTLVGAINKGRRFIGFEINEEYYKIAEKRIKEAMENKAGEV